MGFNRLQRRVFLRKFKVFAMKGLLPIIGCAVIIFLGFYFLKEKGIPRAEVPQVPKTTSSMQIHDAIVNGDYNTVFKLLDENNAANSADASLKQIHTQVMSELKIDMKFHYLPGQRRPVTAPKSENPTLSSNDPYYLTINASDRCYVYILKVNSEQSIDQLFPIGSVPTANPIPPGSLRIPDGSEWLRLGTRTGVERIYLVASRWRNDQIEEQVAKINAERDPVLLKQWSEKLLARLRIEEEATDKVPGLVYGTYQFNHI
jgi:hypothetical protein